MPDTFPTPWLNKYNEFHIPHDVPVFDRPLYAALDDAARDYPDRPAILYGDSRISYKRLHLLAERFSASLHRLGLKKGDRVALMLPNLPQTVVAYWGILKCGGVVVMTNPLYMETELIGHLNDAGCRFMILLDTYCTK
ncbi:MAG: AMP-binding protein, partial [Desulfovibrio sp.]